MTTKPKPDVAVSFIDNPHAPEFFADEASGFFVHNGNLSITFAAARIDHTISPGPLNRVVMARIVLPINVAQALALGLFDFLKSQGMDPTKAATTGETMQ